MGAEEKEKDNSGEEDFEKVLEEREKLDAYLQNKFTQVLTVMFTDLKGSTALADAQGDIASRILVKRYLEIIFPAIERHNGVLVKTIGDGTLSYFKKAQDAVRAASEIQKSIDDYIVSEKPKAPVLMRVGMHTGRCLVEKNDIFGDVVNTASRFESIAEPSSIFLSEDTYNALDNKSEIPCRFIKTTELKGKKESFRVYKAYWNKNEIPPEPGKPAAAVTAEAVRTSFLTGPKLIVMIAVAVILIIIFMFGGKLKSYLYSPGEKRTIKHSM